MGLIVLERGLSALILVGIVPVGNPGGVVITPAFVYASLIPGGRTPLS